MDPEELGYEDDEEDEETYEEEDEEIPDEELEQQAILLVAGWAAGREEPPTDDQKDERMKSSSQTCERMEHENPSLENPDRKGKGKLTIVSVPNAEKVKVREKAKAVDHRYSVVSQKEKGG